MGKYTVQTKVSAVDDYSGSCTKTGTKGRAILSFDLNTVNTHQALSKIQNKKISDLYHSNERSDVSASLSISA